jgi:hypothetical protein
MQRLQALLPTSEHYAEQSLLDGCHCGAVRCVDDVLGRLPGAGLGVSPELEQLVLCRLIGGADAGVEGGASGLLS